MEREEMRRGCDGGLRVIETFTGKASNEELKRKKVLRQYNSNKGLRMRTTFNTNYLKTNKNLM